MERCQGREVQDEMIARFQTQFIAAQAASVDAERERVVVSKRNGHLQLALVAMQESVGQEKETARSEIAQLEAFVGQLRQELEQERAEGRRKDSENVVQEASLAEAYQSLREAQQQYETYRASMVDQLSREKTALEGELSAQRDRLQAELDKARVDMQAVELTVATLRNEHATMMGEVAGMSAVRDAAVALAAQQARDDGIYRAELVGGVLNSPTLT